MVLGDQNIDEFAYQEDINMDYLQVIIFCQYIL